jgi:hypothetical protein
MAGSVRSGQGGVWRWRHAQRFRALRRLWRPALHVVLGAGLVVQTAGCTRSYYRKKTDEQVSEILAQKDRYPAWAIEQFHVYPDPRARFGDPSDPDHPPKPPDDPAAFAMAPNPQKPPKEGVELIEGKGYLDLIAKWDQENRERLAKEEQLENVRDIEPALPEEGGGGEESEAPPKVVARLGLPLSGLAATKQEAATGREEPTPQPPAQKDAIVEAKERSLLDVTGRPRFLLTLDNAAQLAVFNSREAQDAREDLYLAALPVALQRFTFMAQFFAAQEAIREASGRESPGGRSNDWTLNTGTGLSKVLPTGALLLLNFSNQTVFNFLNPKNTQSTTFLNFDAIQPLLRGGGKAVALESLTVAERNLLYQIRNYARFRKELYVEIASNNGGAISGSAFQPTGVLAGGGGISAGGVGNSGLQIGVNPPVQTTITGAVLPPTGPGGLPLPRAITPAPSGYLNTMLQNIQVYIDKENIDVLSSILERFRGLLEGDVVGPLQVQSVEQQLLAGRATLLLDQTQYLQSLDSFKLTIGVPMTLQIEMDDSVLRPLIKQYRRARAITEDEQAAVREASTLIALEKAPTVREELRRLFLRSALVRGTPFTRTIGPRWGEWEKLSDDALKARLDDLRKQVQQLLDLQASLHEKGEVVSPADRARLRQLNSQLDLGNFERMLRQYTATYVEMGQPKRQDVVGERRRVTMFQSVLSYWQQVLVEARDDRWAQVRATWPELPRCCVDGVDLVYDDLDHAKTVADQHALTNRLDLMNVRAQLVDNWRQIAIFANALLGTFNVQYHLSANSPLKVPQPLNIGGSGTTHELFLDTQLPLVRIQQQLNYRASLISYQRQRRVLQEAEDLAVQAVENEIFLLRQYANQYKLQQRQLELAYLTIDSALESLTAPTPPGAGLTGGDGPAALTQQLLTAQRTLPTAQNGLLQIWINYLDERLKLYRDLELMPLDERGLWIDRIKECECPPEGGEQTSGAVPEPKLPAPEMLPPPTPSGPTK